MNFVEFIADQVAAVKRPLVAVTVAAVPRPDTPVILALHWHGFVCERIAPLEVAIPVRYTAIPSTAVQINTRWRDLVSLDLAALDAAWQFGAWDAIRTERPGCLRPGADVDEALDCRRVFAAVGDDWLVADAPDAEDLYRLAGRSGYLCWTFRPVRGGIWREVTDDVTLDDDGARKPPCPHLPVAPKFKGPRRTVYRFGSAGRLLTI